MRSSVTSEDDVLMEEELVVERLDGVAEKLGEASSLVDGRKRSPQVSISEDPSFRIAHDGSNYSDYFNVPSQSPNPPDLLRFSNQASAPSLVPIVE